MVKDLEGELLVYRWQLESARQRVKLLEEAIETLTLDLKEASADLVAQQKG